jgi:hypothetical protein
VEKIDSYAWYSRIGRLLWWLGPVLFLLWLDRYGLKTWFMQDDFAWLGLLRETHRSRTLLNALFAPEAQGTIRPWSERGFFLVFESLFGLDSLPFHICIFATMAADAVLIAWITLRVTGSRIAGFLAPVLWVANDTLATDFAWTSAYNEPLCALFLLSAMALFIRFAETGRKVFWWLQLAVFVLGFGALEINVVYPALAAAYAIFAAPVEKTKPKLLYSLIPLFCISIVYYIAHRAAVPFPAEGPYAIHLDSRIFRTFATYWNWVLIPDKWPGRFLRRGHLLFWLTTASLAGFLAWQTAKRRYAVLFFGTWFLIALGPMLLLPEHLTDYYVTIALIGLAMAAASGIASAWRAGWPWRVAALVLVSCYLDLMVGASFDSTLWWMNRSRQARAVALGAAAAQRSHPGKYVVLDGITGALYDDSIGSGAFYTQGLDYVYLTPGTEDKIHPTINPETLPKLALDPAVMKKALTRDDVVVYSVNGDHLRNITEAYKWSAPERFLLDSKSNQEPRRVEVGNPLFAYLLGPEWFGLESGVRWMPRRATVRMGGPISVPGLGMDRLLLEGFRPDPQLMPGVLHLSVTVDGVPLADTEIGVTEIGFHRLLEVPASLAGRDTVEVALSVDRVMRDPGGRQLGLVFGTIAFERRHLGRAVPGN